MHTYNFKIWRKQVTTNLRHNRIRWTLRGIGRLLYHCQIDIKITTFKLIWQIITEHYWGCGVDDVYPNRRRSFCTRAWKRGTDGVQVASVRPGCWALVTLRYCCFGVRFLLWFCVCLLWSIIFNLKQKGTFCRTLLSKFKGAHMFWYQACSQPSVVGRSFFSRKNWLFQEKVDLLDLLKPQ